MYLKMFNSIKNFFFTFNWQRSFHNNYFITLRLYNKRYYVLLFLHLLFSFVSGDFSYVMLTYEEFLQLLHLQNIPLPPLFLNNPLDDKAVGTTLTVISILIIIWILLGCPSPSISEIITERPPIENPDVHIPERPPIENPDVHIIEEQFKESYTFFDVKAKNNRIAKKIDYSIKKFENSSDFFNKSAEEYKDQASQLKVDLMEIDKQFKESERELLQANIAYNNAYTLKHQAYNAYATVKKDRRLKLLRKKIRKLKEQSVIDNFTQEEIDLNKIQLEEDLKKVSEDVGLNRIKDILDNMIVNAERCEVSCNNKAVITYALKQFKEQNRLKYEVAKSRTQPFSVKFFKSLRSFFGAK